MRQAPRIVLMFVFMYVCMYVCIYVCICVLSWSVLYCKPRVMQNSSQLQPRGEFALEHLPVHVVQELKPGMVIRTAESDQPRVKDPHKQDPVSRTRDLHGAIGGVTMQLHHKKRCSHVFTDSQTHVP